MSNILETIIAYKKQEVAKQKEHIPLAELEARSAFQRKTISLKEAIKDPLKTGIIAEFKRKSPSKVDINTTSKVEDVTQKYATFGASGLSILTDAHFFGGNNKDIEKARAVNNIPILRKEFVIDEYQIWEAKAIGADVILLIAECLSKDEVKHLARFATELGLEVLLEMHSEMQIDKLIPEITLAGINNRDLTTFKVDIDRSIQLANKLPKEMIKIAESGINDPKVIFKLKEAGFDGFLMGEHFMKEEDPGEAFRIFAEQLK